MTFLAVVGAVVITAALIYFSLSYSALFIMSDETIWFAFKHYPVPMICWVVVGLILLASWTFWLHFLFTHITIGLV